MLHIVITQVKVS